ncbi:MAG: hypothetical protein NDJ90_01135 [Oligoflexia bacterium]|nr:hypothetical protein [Oligoflexia bacterium]
MNANSPFGLPSFDPSKMDPKLLLELSQLIRELPPEKLNQMQALMHNMMAGFDVRRELEDFEKSLPPGFRERLMAILAKQAAAEASIATSASPVASTETATPPEAAGIAATPAADRDIRQARLTLLQAVADGRLSPEEAERTLFPS